MFFGKFSKHGSLHILSYSFFISLIVTIIENDIESPPL